ncbi:hypothetical protein SDC9_205430 [bioreactor metagenome]|uniref:Uncharacterized protein n=1 Tax=bioreactor metagenome TaxID=1076179 RepID=A0A645J2S1_9ZZZZ
MIIGAVRTAETIRLSLKELSSFCLAVSLSIVWLLMLALYPSFSIALIISSGDAEFLSNVTVAVSVIKLTFAFTSGILFSFLSMAAEQAAQDIPLTFSSNFVSSPLLTTL